MVRSKETKTPFKQEQMKPCFDMPSDRSLSKTAALILTAVVLSVRLICSLCDEFDIAVVGICRDAGILARLSYSFFHASLIHAIINCWCLLSVVFVYNVPLSHLVIAYIIAVTYPADTLCGACGEWVAAVPTVGLSAVCFALLGMVAFKVRRKLYFQTWIITFIAISFILPHLCSLYGLSVASPNNILHIYSYVAGLIVGFLNSPAPWIRK